jgi:hypothetical protein
MSPKKNPFLDDPNANPSVQTAANIDVINAMSAVLLQHGRANEDMFERFKKLFDGSGLKLWIVFAGVGGIVELLRLAIDAIVLIRGK